MGKNNPKTLAGEKKRTDSAFRELPDRKRDSHPGNPDKPIQRRSQAEVAGAREEYDLLRAEIEDMKQMRLEMLAELDLGQEKDARQEELTRIKSIAGLQGVQQHDEYDSDYNPEDTDIKMDEAPKTGLSAAEIIPAKDKRADAAVDADPFDALGGLQEDDIETPRPQALPTKGTATVIAPVQGRLKDNELVGFSRNPATPKPTLRALPASSTKKKGKKDSTGDTFNSPIVLRKQSSVISISSTSSASSVISIANSPLAGGDDCDGIPPLFRPLWLKSILPTIYHTFFTFEQPFPNSLKKELVPVVKNILGIVVPGHTYQVTEDCNIVNVAYERIVDKRSLFGRNAINVVKEYFSQPQYANDEQAVRKYVMWALRRNGPALFKLPTPEECTVDKKDPNYIVSSGFIRVSVHCTGLINTIQKPYGLYESSFVIKTMAPILKVMQNTLGGYGEPAGAIGLAAAAVSKIQYLNGPFSSIEIQVERAFQMFKTGAFVKGGAFSKPNAGRLVDDYVKNLKNFEEKHWIRIREACGVITTSHELEKEVAVGAPSLDYARADLFERSSPPPMEE
ncbi:hypothetical protein H0H81_010388 [Sphagnurus paluster]|uniref:Uncharacterized protein n=1 Tax=Sphagnurus paluster TaxID=117069 RepID=A0A9P7KG19_9AGAR|nr:hypothetical protein H0H81_010388 [Sphagnurus paluster]